MVPKEVLLRSGLVSLTTARPVNTAQPKTTVNSARPMTNVFNKAHSTVKRPIDNKQQLKKTGNTCPILLTLKNYGGYVPLKPVDLLFSQCSKSSPVAGLKPSSDGEKKVDGDPSKEDESNDQEKDGNVNSTNNVNTASDGNITNNVNVVSSTVNAAGIEVNVVGAKTSIELPDDPNMSELKDIVYSDDDKDVGAEAHMNNLDVFMPVSPIPTTRVHKDHPVEQITGDLNLAPQTRRMTKNLEEHVEPKKVWTLVDLPNGKRPIGTKWVFRNKKDERGIVIKNKARLVAQGYTKEEGIDYDEIEKEVYVCQPPGFEDPDFPNKVYKVEKILKKFDFTDVKTANTPMETQKLLLKDEDGEEVDVNLYRSMISSLMYLTSSRPDIMFAVCQPKLGLWYLKDSPFDLVAYIDSDYARASLDRKSTTGGCQFLKCRLISWQCKKQTVVANSTTEAEYVAASSCCGQVLWIQNQLLDYGDSNEKKLIQMIKIHTDKNVADLLTKAFDVKTREWGSTDTSLVGWEEDSVYPRRPKRKDTEVPQPSDPTNVADEAVNEDNEDMFGVHDLDGDEVVVESEVTDKAGRERNIIEEAVAVTDACYNFVSAVTITNVELTLAQILAELKKNALRLQAKFDEEDRLAREKAQQVEEANIAWDDIARNRWVNTFVDMDTKLVEGSEVRAEGSETRKESSSKRAGDELEQEKAKKQKVDEDKETAELQSLMKIVPDAEEVAIDVIPLATKPPSIVDYKIIKEGKISYYQIIRVDGSSKRHSTFIQMLRSFDREDLETLWKLVKAKHGSKRPEEGYERVLWGDLKIMLNMM
ncbi:putative ribonuclease H-like domain-containing protein [Tanacetum coccineum]